MEFDFKPFEGINLALRVLTLTSDEERTAENQSHLIKELCNASARETWMALNFLAGVVHTALTPEHIAALRLGAAALEAEEEQHGR